MPVAIVFFLLALDIFAGLFLTLFAQLILLATGMAILN